MSRWIRGIIWVTGSCALASPLLICAHGGGPWWVCACSLGLLSITMMSGYATWTLISQILYNPDLTYDWQKKLLPPTPSNSPEQITTASIESTLEEEVRLTALTFHKNLVLPWYLFISPDEKYSLLIQSAFEDVLAGACKNIGRHVKAPLFLRKVTLLYVQHYRQFFRALKKVSRNHQKRPYECLSYHDELIEVYRPIHPALQSEDALHLHLRTLAELLLVNYLPPDLSGCAMVLTCLKDIFVQNILFGILDCVSKPGWISDSLAEVIDGPNSLSQTKDLSLATESSVLIPSSKQFTSHLQSDRRGLNCMHMLSVISEESSLDVLSSDKNSYLSDQDGSEINHSNNHGDSAFKSFSETDYGNDDLAQSIYMSSSLSQDTENVKKHSVVTGLGGIISASTVPVLSNIALTHNKMWESPVEENHFYESIENQQQCDNVEKIEDKTYSYLDPSVSNVSNQEMDHLAAGSGTVPRSKSLNNILSKTEIENETLKLYSKSVSDEELNVDQSLCKALSCPSIDENPRKCKGYLRKMSSFDKNDGVEQDQQEISYPESFSAECPTNSEVNDPKDTAGSGPDGEISEETSTDKVCPNDQDANLSLPDEPEKTARENSDLSPIYEESQNLESAIAKLRCLLSERQSQRSLGSQSSFGSSSEGEPRSAKSDPGRTLHDRTRFSFHRDASGSVMSLKSTSSSDSSNPLSISEDEALEAAELPPSGKIFVSVSIPATEVQSENVGFQYTVYIIQFEAIYLCENENPTTAEAESGSGNVDLSEPKMILQTNDVKRRFREFLVLHAAMEDDPVLRGAMKGIKGPNKWLNLPFSKLDSATISSRKQFLEKYLQALIQRPLINSCSYLKEFLGYGFGDSVGQGDKKPLDWGVNRLDKILARTVTGVFNSLKTALPNFDSLESPQQGQLVPGPIQLSNLAAAKYNLDPVLAKKIIGCEEKLDFKDRLSILDDLGIFEVQLDITAEEEICSIEQHMLSSITSEACATPVEDALEAQEFPVFQKSFYPYMSNRRQSPAILNMGVFQKPTDTLISYWRDIGVMSPLPRLELQDSLESGDAEFDGSSSLFSALSDALVELLLSVGNSTLTRRGAFHLITQIGAKPISDQIQLKLNEALDDEFIRNIFSQIRYQCSPLQDTKEVSQAEAEERFRNALIRTIPGYVEFVLGSETLNESIALFVASFQHSIVNQDLALHLIDLVFGHLLLPL